MRVSTVLATLLALHALDARAQTCTFPDEVCLLCRSGQTPECQAATGAYCTENPNALACAGGGGGGSPCQFPQDVCDQCDVGPTECQAASGAYCATAPNDPACQPQGGGSCQFPTEVCDLCASGQTPECQAATGAYCEQHSEETACQGGEGGGPGGPGKSPVDIARMQYFIIMGFPDDATYDQLNANAGDESGRAPPREGIIGLVRQRMGSDNGIGRVLVDNGIAGCADVPDNGSVSGTVPGLGDVVVTFEPAVHVVPEGYAGAGESYAKRVVASVAGAPVFAVDFSCTRSGAWVQLSFTDDGGRRDVEMAFDESDATAPKADMITTYAPETRDERYVIRFRGQAGGRFDMWMARAAFDNGVDAHAIRLVVSGDAGTARASILVHELRGASMAELVLLPGASRDDVEADGLAVVAGCAEAPEPPLEGACAELPLAAADPQAPVFDAAGSYAIDWACRDDGLAAAISKL